MVAAATSSHNESLLGQRIAVIGSGIAGMTAAHYLSRAHKVTLFESAGRFGGHTATQTVVWQGVSYAVDMGFIVYNDWTYPNFIRLLNELNVASQPAAMGFSVTQAEGTYEYAGANLNTLFAQRRNLFRPSHWKMLFDILRFNREATASFLAGGLSEQESLKAYLIRNKFSAGFIKNYLAPMGAAIWSSSTEEVLEFSVYFFVRFFHNHGLLSVKQRPQWRVLKGGSSSYIKPLLATVGNCISGMPIKRVQRTENSVIIYYEDEHEEFDQVVFACHSDEALHLLIDANPAEREVLSAITYRSNRVTLHRDINLLPKRRLAWSSWNYLLQNASNQPPLLTYNMNILQNINAPITFCVTLNDSGKIKSELILQDLIFAHPVFSATATQAQGRWAQINGVNKTWFAGAYWFNGFHEDGVVSALRVVNALGVDIPVLNNNRPV
ncbi:MAG TPA: FAD-dependent oxidoreductase [Cellvibrionaceae bacterium]